MLIQIKNPIKRKSNKKVFVFLLLFLISCFPHFCMAQIGDPGEDPDAPIDGGVSVLIAAGVGYGLKKAHDHRKKASKGSLQENDKQQL